MKKLIYVFCLSSIIVASAYYMYSSKGKDNNKLENSIVSHEEETKQEVEGNPIVPEADDGEEISCHDFFVQKMAGMDIQQDLIEKIYACNEMVFTSWYEYNPQELDRQIGAFSCLKGKLDIQQRLLKDPDFATLTAAVAAVDVESARTLLDSLPEDSEDGIVVRSLYALYATPNDAIHLSRMLCSGANQKYIIELFKQGCGDIAFLKFFELLEENRETAPHAALVYQKWLYSLLDEMLAADPESDDADNNYVLLVSQSEPLMETLKSNEEFCEHFFVKYWNDYSEILKSIPSDDEYKEAKFLSYISNDDLWNFLIAYPETGVQLVKIYGEFAPYFLMKKEFLDNPLAKERIATLMLSANNEQEQAFCQIPDDVLFLYAKFLQRNLDYSTLMNGTLVIVNAENLGSDSCAKAKLQYWDEKLSDEALKRDDDFANNEVTLTSFITGYDICVVIYKCFDGRNITKSDMAMAGIDTVFLIPEAIAFITAPATSGGSVVTVESAKGAIKGAVKLGVKSAAKQTAKQAVKNTSKSVVKRIMLAGVKASRQVVRKEWIAQTKNYLSKMTKYDITSKIQTIFEKSLMKNSTFKKISGLDARIFMRSDRRIYFNLGTAVKKIAGANVTKVITDDVLIGSAGYMILSQPEVQDAFINVKNSIEKSISQKSEDENWKADLSAWWMINQYGKTATDNASSDKAVADGEPSEDGEPSDKAETELE